MVSNWRFWSAKEITSGGRQPFQLVALLALVGALIAWKSELMLMVIAMGYLVSGVFARLAYSWGTPAATLPWAGVAADVIAV